MMPRSFDSFLSWSPLLGEDRFQPRTDGPGNPCGVLGQRPRHVGGEPGPSEPANLFQDHVSEQKPYRLQGWEAGERGGRKEPPRADFIPLNGKESPNE